RRPPRLYLHARPEYEPLRVNVSNELRAAGCTVVTPIAPKTGGSLADWTEESQARIEALNIATPLRCCGDRATPASATNCATSPSTSANASTRREERRLLARCLTRRGRHFRWPSSPAATASSFSILTSRRGGRRSRHGRTARARLLPDADPRADRIGCRGSGAASPSLSRPAPVHLRRELRV